MASGSQSHGEAFDEARLERDRTLICVREVEDALGQAAGNEGWVEALAASLESLHEAMTEERRELDEPDSLLTLIANDRPRRFKPRVRGIREQYGDIARQLDSFRRELAASDGSATEISDMRHRVSWIIRALHNCRDRQADLVFDAIGLDLGEMRD